MSATNRGPKNGGEFEDHPTPLWAVWRFLEYFQYTYSDRVTTRWLEPSAGSGNIIRAVNAFRKTKQYPAAQWAACEIQSQYWASLRQLAPFVNTDDFLTTNNWPVSKFDVAIGNPPYSKAMEFIQKTRPMAGVVAMLLRLNFLGSKKRRDYWRYDMPTDIYVLPNRPSCGLNKHGKKGTDACEYGWFVWQDTPEWIQTRGIFSRTHVLDITSHAADQMVYGINL